jgi:glycosyltransferase involved in cell wall biosynthesis
MTCSVVICSHNSRLDYLQGVLDALRGQTMPLADWELVVVDNASREPLAPRIDVSWHPRAKVIRNDVPESEAALVDARSLGIRETTGAVIVFVDDDNVLAPDYLATADEISANWPRLGAWGGNIRLLYEKPKLALPPALEGLLCCREVASPLWSNVIDHHESTPWGAGLCVRRTVATTHLARLAAEPDRRQLDPAGREMRFGGDTDMVYTGLHLGYGKGVFPSLNLTHLIPARRCDPAFLARALEAHGYSAALHGWLDTGQVDPPRNDLRFYAGEAWRWFRRDRWQRLIVRMKRRGHWRAYQTLRGTTPRRAGP